MKVISEDCTLVLLESLKFNLEHAVKMLEISIKAKEGSDWDLGVAKGNLAQVERLIFFVKANSFNARELYQPGEIA